ncbi:unnamed protein product [Allacma fusca]|uniref:Uncharacterized protein n=1 Tax=Allacma fusca TaxID=39272 RepID=A0A8J2LRD4_9HEXA|nr:unnamed protein product [Allacma fusca]
MHPQEKVLGSLTRDELKESNCCRFCGYGAKKEISEGDEFTRIYEKSVVEGEELRTVTLDVVINKYLPITVSSHELYYPQVICSVCTSSLNVTVEFFQNIVKGQKILASIINEVSPTKSQDKLDEDEPSPLIFSGENPILLAPKRRGRPRRDPNKPKTPKVDVLSSDYLDSKPKRLSRRPVRYDEPTSSNLCEVVIKEEVEDIAEPSETNSCPFLNEENLEPNIILDADGIKSNEANAAEDLKTDNNNLILQNVSTEFTSLTRADNLMDLSKLSVIMDGDEEMDTTSNVDMSGHNAGIVNCIKSGVVPDSLHLSDGLVPGSVTNATLSAKSNSGLQEEDDAVICLTEEPVTNETCNDSDVSVRTVDFVTKKKTKKGRKKARRKSSKKKIECEACHKEFSHPSSLAYHRNAAHGDKKKFACTICGKAFTHKQLLLNHSYVHSDEKIFKCNLCPAKFKSKASLYTHNKSIHTTNNAHTCDHCGSRFNLKSSLKAHLRLHTGEKPYSCEFCHKRFSQKSNYTEHRRIHTGERPYKCDTANCDKAFTTASQLRSHKITHTGSKQYLCSICGRGFTHGENFKYHMRRHNGEKPLECPICLKQFTEPWSLKKHCRMHTGEKPYTCEVCNKLFSDPSNYAKHKRAHHFDGMVVQELQESIQRQVQSNQQFLNTATKIEVNQPVDTQVVSQIIEGAEQSGEDSTVDNGYVHILNADNLNSIEEGTQDGQVIYLYPDELQYYTIMISDNQDSVESRPNEETLQTLGGTIALAVDADLAAQYFNMDNVSSACIAGSTIGDGEEVAPVSVTTDEAEITKDCVEPSKSNLLSKE